MGLVESINGLAKIVAQGFNSDRKRIAALEAAAQAKLVNVTPSDTDKLAGVASKLFAGSAGTVAVLTKDGKNLTFTVNSGESLDVPGVIQVLATGTTVPVLIALVN